MTAGNTSTQYHLSYVYWNLRASLDEAGLHDTPLDAASLNDALTTVNISQDASLDPMKFFMDMMYLEELRFIQKYREIVKINNNQTTLSLQQELASRTKTEGHASSEHEQKKKIKVKCPRSLKGKSSPAVVTYLKSISSNPITQSMLAKKFLDYAASHNRHYPAVHMNEIKKIEAMADRVKVIPGLSGQPSRLFVGYTKDPSQQDEVEKSIKAHFGSN